LHFHGRKDQFWQHAEIPSFLPKMSRKIQGWQEMAVEIKNKIQAGPRQEMAVEVLFLLKGAQ